MARMKYREGTKDEMRMYHRMTHTLSYQKRMGCARARMQHNNVVRRMLKKGMSHNSPFVCLVKKPRR